MSNRERIIDFVTRFPGRDDDEISLALQIMPRQQVNQASRGLEKAGRIERLPLTSGKLGNFPKGGAAAILTHPRARQPKRADASDATQNWFWEGNVVEALAQFLADDGWTLLSKADTHSKQQGLDLHAKRGNQELLVEAKGYPSRHYRDPARAREAKPTNPTNQAQHWYAHALLKVLRLRSAHPGATPAIALPDMPRYRSLFEETVGSLEELGIAVLFVDEHGGVEARSL